MIITSSWSPALPLTLGVKLRWRSMRGIYDEEALMGSGLFLHVSSMFGGDTRFESRGLSPEPALKADINL